MTLMLSLFFDGLCGGFRGELAGGEDSGLCGSSWLFRLESLLALRGRMGDDTVLWRLGVAVAIAGDSGGCLLGRASGVVERLGVCGIALYSVSVVVVISLL